MADEIDVANEYADRMVAQGMAAINLKPEVEPTGYCLNCGEQVQDNKRWCSVTCTRDWEKRSKHGNK